MKKSKPQKQNYRNVASRIAGYLARISYPAFAVRLFIKIYVKFYKIDISKFIVPDKFFKNFNEFFTRQYKSSEIDIQKGVISPVDGYLLDRGMVKSGLTITVKNRDYYLTDLLGQEYKDLSSYAVLYLDPGNYHRVHASFDLSIYEIQYLPGTLRSVKTKVIYKKDRVYCRNERIVIIGDSKYGKFYMILVGALLVGKVRLSFESGLFTNIRKGIASSKKYPKPICIKKGQELGYFELGSSVVMLMEDKSLAQIKLKETHPVRFGEHLF